MRIEIDDLVHEYVTGVRALDGVNLVIEGSAPLAIIGQNGAGKTTLVKHLNGILRPTSGSVTINDINVNDKSTAEWSSTVGYVFQNPDDQLFLESVRSEFEFGPKQIGMEEDCIGSQVSWAADLVGLSDRLDTNPFDLSPTDKKFCAIGAVLAMDPKIVLFDEPTCGQDLKGTARLDHIIETLTRQGKLCIAISHDMKFVARCFPRVVVMCQGRILVEGTRENVFSQTDLLKKSFVLPPPICRVAQGVGINEPVFEVGSLVNEIRKMRSRSE